MFGILLRQTHVFELWKGPESCIRYNSDTPLQFRIAKITKTNLI